ncbi:MAG TPA: S41 family peptidase [Bacteroidota bacterium]|nr:S41 family peptidase [Bacteroidota bacterium]
MTFRFSLATALSLLMTTIMLCQENPLWMRYPAISPDGKTILFEYKGDIYSVASDGGTAIPLTLSESYEFAPVWSHDGKSIAFASDRYGNFDVFVMPANGGEAKRLTFNSTSEIPATFSADDKSVLFTAYRQELPTNVQFPTGMMVQLYSVSVNGGRVSLVLPIPTLNATLNSTGDKVIYDDLKGYESLWRKHHTSSVTHDIWVYDFKTKQYLQLTQFDGEDRNPVFDSNDNDFYYLTEQSGSFNVYKSSLSDPSKSEALTHYTKDPVRFLTLAKDNTLCFGFNGEVYTMKPGGDPQKLNVRIGEDGRETLDKVVPVNEKFTEMKLSPNGKEFAYVFRGEIFVTSMEGGITKRITNTPWQERSVSFSPDGRSLVYAAEKDSNWDVYKVSIVRKEEPYFYASTILKEEPVIATEAEEFQPAFSPDGKEVAYLENRVTLKVVDLATKQTRTIMSADKNYSYADGDQYYEWSPDGKWFLVQFAYPERIFTPEVGLVSSDGKGEIHNLTLSGYDNYTPKWAMDGKMMIWGSDRNGTREQGGGIFSGDVYGMFFTKAAFDRFKLTKEEFALVKEQEDKEKKGTDEKAKGEKKEKESKAEKDSLPQVVIDWNELTDRKSRLTSYTSPVGDWVLSKDGEKLFYLTSFDKGNDLWTTELRTKETKLFAKLGADHASMELSPDGKFIFLDADGKPMKVDAESGKAEPIRTGGEMVLKEADERDYIFYHAWRQFKEKILFPDMQGVDWSYYYNDYKKFLPYINNDYDFSEMLSEMLGEANVSHTGCYYRHAQPNSDQTADLGLLYDFSFTGNGVKIAEVVEGGPIDKAASKIRAGNIIEAIDGETITPSIDFYELLNRKVGKLTLLSVYDPEADKRWEETVKPISAGEESELLYQRWVKNRREEVDKLSNGEIGYVHVRSMNDASMRTVFEEALGRNVGKKALIVDTRFNGGGNIHEQLSDFLSGKKYFDIIPHGQYVGSEPYDKWTKPSIVLIGESDYSDAHLFPVAYKLKGIGKTLGMPVPGTGTFVWWEGQIDPNLVFGIPMGGWRTPDGKFCENTQLEPDIKVRNDPAIMTNGRDQQIEAAVKELMKK